MMKFGMMFGAALVLAPVSAEAAITVTDYAFTSSFERGIYPTLSGTFSLSHDSDSGVYALTALHYEIEGFTHDLSNSSIWYFLDGAFDRVAIYGNVNDRVVSHHTTDFDFIFAVGGGSNQVSTVYSTPTAFVIPAGSTILNQVSVPPVPEPSSWMTMIAGFALAGSVLRHRKANVRYAF
jgi:hypothetical protein